MELKGKKVFFLGDSITEGHGTSCEEKCYVSVFDALSGAEVKIIGIGGTWSPGREKERGRKIRSGFCKKGG